MCRDTECDNDIKLAAAFAVGGIIQKNRRDCD
jgi:hypothetical protein